LASWARHGKYREIEDAQNQPDFLLPIDHQDSLGNTLLSIAVQNGNKRIAKMCLRRGANINLANNMGQTLLHYGYAYGFEDLADYLKTKGADDRPRNFEGLTCYEGLTQQAIEQI
jgi:ankyrin repeat protein